MVKPEVVFILISCLMELCLAMSQYTDENRPYEFGFNITGEQHRHEKKDENGIIMGEFGFLTADNVYHVTVYATDENGNFKILSMKNLRVNQSSKKTPEARAIPFPKSTPISGGPIAQRPQPLPQAAPVRSCSSCSIPTSPQPPKQLSDLAVVSRDGQQFPPYPDQVQNSRGRQYVPSQNQPKYNTQTAQNAVSNYGKQQGLNGNSQTPGLYGQKPGKYEQEPGQYGQEHGHNSQQLGQPNTQYQGLNPNANQQQSVSNQKPTLVSAQMQIINRNTDVNRLGPGEKRGLPNGLVKDDMLQLLYTFNYTVGFHAHHEEGYTNGIKKGYYYATGRDGVRTRIDYVADSEGFHPKISTEVLELLSDDVPKPETEKEEKYGLKGYEFKWLYYPPNS